MPLRTVSVCPAGEDVIAPYLADKKAHLNEVVKPLKEKEETIYVYGQEDEPVVLDRFSPVLHLVQTARDEAHRFAVTFHRKRRTASRISSELESIPGVGPKTVQKLLRKLGSAKRVREAAEETLVEAVGPVAARRIREHYWGPQADQAPTPRR